MTEIDEIPVEFAGLILEDQLLDHLATPEGANAVWKERFTPDLLAEDEQLGRDAVEFVLEYMDQYREPPNVSVLSEEIGLDEFNEPIAPIEYVLAKLRNRHKKRQVSKVVHEASKKIGKGGDPDETIAFGIEQLTQLRLTSANKRSHTSSAEMELTLEEYHQRTEQGEQGLTFGFEEIDKHTGGLKLGEVNVLVARPKRYKSWLLLKSGVSAFQQEVGNLAFASLELSPEEMRRRFTCMVTNSSWPKFQSNTLRQADLQYMEEVAQDLQEFPSEFHIFRPQPGERTVKGIVSQALEVGAKALYIDQLSWLDGARDERAWQKIGEIMEELKDAAQHFPILMAAQYNRTAMEEEGIADISKIGLSDMVGQTADNLFGVYASKNMMTSDPRIIHLGLNESRAHEPKAWEIRVKLSEESDFKLIQELHD